MGRVSRCVSVAVVAAFGAMQAACTTTAESDAGAHEPRTSVEAAMQKCAGTMVVSTIGGALIGGMIGNRNSVATGALVGAGVGGVACAVMLAVANEEDKRRILENELEAVAAARAKVITYDHEGVRRRVHTQVTDQPRAATPAPARRDSPAMARAKEAGVSCRYAQTTIEVTGQGTTTTDKQLYCKNTVGKWQPSREAAASAPTTG
jgi:hypothetical protein